MSRNLAIVPAYNEADAIATTVAALRQWASDFDVLVIDDGSSDATAARARAAGAAVLRMPFNLGIGGAMQSGYLYAREHGYDVAVQVDGDGQHDPRHIHSLLARLREDPELNMVTGSRFLEPAAEGYRSSAARRIGIRVFSTVISRITGQRVTDPTSGFRMTDRRGIELFARDYPPDYPEVEAILLMHAHRLKSCEIPVVMRPRLTGRSAISSTQSVYYMVKVLLAVFVALFRARPSSEAVETVEAANAVEAGEDAAAAAAAGPAGAARVSEGGGATDRGGGGEVAEARDAVAEGER
jgi:glycosyltransferase involved in cell wall biosynthesis